MSAKSLADDFIDRVTRQCLPSFRESVIPDGLVPYITCLTTIDEELTMAKQRQEGPTLAADVLYRRLVRRPNWFDDLIRALRHPSVGLDFLADEFEGVMCTIPLHYDIDFVIKADCEIGLEDIFESQTHVKDLYEDEVHDGESMTVVKETYCESGPEDMFESQTRVKDLYTDEVHEGDSMTVVKETDCKSVPEEEFESQTHLKDLFKDEVNKGDTLNVVMKTDCESVPEDKFESQTRVKDLYKDENDTRSILCSELKPLDTLTATTETETCSQRKTGKDARAIKKSDCLPSESCSAENTNCDERFGITNMSDVSVKECFRKTETIDCVKDKLKEQHPNDDSYPNKVKKKDQTKTPFKLDRSLQCDQSLEDKKETLRLRFFEKLYGFIEKPEDVPVAIMYMEKINLHISGVDKGSIIVNVKVMTLNDVNRLEELLRYGALRKVIDKDILNNCNLQVLTKLGKEGSLLVENVTSTLQVIANNIKRTRAWLQNKYPREIGTDALDALTAMPETMSDHDIRYRKKMINRIKQKLPDILLKIVEDPFVVDFDTFLDDPRLNPVQQADGHKVSVTECFLAWLEKTMTEYLEIFDGEACMDIAKSAGLVYWFEHYLKFDSIPFKVLSCIETVNQSPAFSITMLNDEMNITKEGLGIPTVNDKTGGFLDVIHVPEIVQVNFNEIERIMQSMMTHKVIRKASDGYCFISNLVRDVFLAKFYGISYIVNPEFDNEKHEFLMCVLGFHELDYRKVSAHIENILYSIRYNKMYTLVKNVVAKHRDQTTEGLVVVGFDFYKPDLMALNILNPNDIRHIVEAANTLENVISTKSHEVQINISEETFETNDQLKWMLKLLNTIVSVSLERLEPLFDKLQQNSKAIVSEYRAKANMRHIEMNLVVKKCDWMDDNCLEMLGRFVRTSSRGVKCTFKEQKNDCVHKALSTWVLTNVTSLNISSTPMDDEIPLALRFLPNLQTLNMENCNLSDRGISQISDEICFLSSLRSLNIAGNLMTHNGLKHLYRVCVLNAHFKSLKLHNNPIGRFGVPVLSNIIESQSLLEILDISNCILNARRTDDIGLTEVYDDLVMQHELKVEDTSLVILNKIGADGLMRLDFSKNTSLMTLNIAYNDFKWLHMSASITAALCTDCLVNLDISGNQFTNVNHPQEQVTMKDFVKGLSSVRSFKADNTDIGRLELLFKDAEKFDCFTNISYLSFQNCHILDTFILHLADCLEANSHVIVAVDFTNNCIGNGGTKRLVYALRDKRHIREILLDRNRISAGCIMNMRLILNITRDKRLNPVNISMEDQDLGKNACE